MVDLGPDLLCGSNQKKISPPFELQKLQNFPLKHQINYSENQAKEMFSSTASQKGKSKASSFPKQGRGSQHLVCKGLS